MGKHLEDAEAAHEARVLALRAALGVVERDVAAAGQLPHAELRDHLGQRLVRLLAVRAQLAHEPLREDADHGGREQIVVDTHVEQAVDRRGGVVGVHRGQHEVAGEGGLHRDLRGLPGRGSLRS
jgi:hypothetical protein